MTADQEYPWPITSPPERPHRPLPAPRVARYRRRRRRHLHVVAGADFLGRHRETSASSSTAETGDPSWTCPSASLLPRQLPPLLPPPRPRRARLLVAAALQPGKVLEDARRLLAQRAPLAANVGAHPEVLPDTELREQATTFGNVRDAGARDRVRLAARDLLALEHDLAGVPHGSRHRAQGRRLAGSVGSEQSDDLAFRDCQRDTVQRLDRPVPRLDSAQLKQRRQLRPPGRPRSRPDLPAPRRAFPRRSCGRS